MKNILIGFMLGIATIAALVYGGPTYTQRKIEWTDLQPHFYKYAPQDVYFKESVQSIT